MVEYVNNYSVDTSNIKKADRTLVLEVIDGTLPKSSTGLVDSRLFSGENNLHAVMDPQTMLWSLRYEHGGVPTKFKQTFTSFPKLKKFVDDYLILRNIRIKEVLD